MRLIKIEIENIASIEKATIDFESPELTDQPIFLITGPTGSGKSTILDAIALALYDKTPRMAMNTDGKIKGEDDKEYDISKTVMLMRKGAENAKATLTFEALDGKVYKATWATRKKRTGALDSVQRTLEQEGNSNYIIEKAKEVSEEIKKLIGLDYEQFTKTTLLAQGEFTRFLKSKIEEKSAILEKITGTDIYSKIGKQIFLKYQDAKNNVEKKESKLEAIAVLSQEERSAKETELQDINARANEIVKQIKIAEDQLKWIQEEETLTQKQMSATDDYEKAKQKSHSEEMESNAETTALWEKTEDVRKEIEKKDKGEEEQKKLESKSSTFKSQFGDVCATMAWTRTECSQKEANALAIKEKLKPYEALEPMLNYATQICSQIATVINFDDNISENLKRKEENEASLPTQKAKTEKIGKDAKAIDDQINICKEQIKVQNRAKAELNETEANDRKNKLDELNKAISDAETKLANAVADDKSLEETEKKLEDLKQKQPAAVKNSEEENGAKKQAEEAYRRKNETLDDVERIIKNLSDGAKCPVCGGVYHTQNPISETLKKELDEEKSRLDAATAEAEKAQKELTDLNSSIQTAESNHKSAQNKHELSKEMADKSWTALCSKAKECGIRMSIERSEESNEVRKEAMAQIISEAQKSCEENQNVLNKIQAISKECEKLQDKLSEYLQEQNKLNTELAKANSELEATQKRITEAKQSIENSSGKRNEHWQQIEGKILYGEGWKNLSLKELSQKIDADSKTLVNGRTKQKEAEQEHQNLASILKYIEEKYGEFKEEQKWILIWDKLINWEAQPAKAPQINEIQDQWNKFINDCRNWHNDIIKARKTVEEAKEAIGTFFEQNADICQAKVEEIVKTETVETIAAKRNKVTKAKEEERSALALMSNAVKELETHHKERPELPEGATANTLTQQVKELKETQNQANKDSGRLQQELDTDKKNSAEAERLDNELKAAKNDYDDWSKLNDMFGTQQNPKFRTVAQRYIFGGLLSCANEYLRQLSNGRFTLTNEGSDDALSIQIRDAYSADAMLTTTNISGGESFLVSLSLALALSSMAAGQNNVTPDIVFIDEGFGTLDPVCLDRVMEFLTKVQQIGGRRVGLISHMADVRDRIPVQIRLSRPANGVSTVSVVAPERKLATH